MPNVIYDGNGNTGGAVPATASYALADTVTVAGAGALAKTDYAFLNWNTLADGTGTNYIAGSTFSMGDTDLTLYAKWNLVTARVYYHDNGATNIESNNPSPFVVTQTVGAVVTTEHPANIGWERSHFTYDRWTTAADGTGTVYVFGSTFIMPAQDVILYSKWLRISYRILFDWNYADKGTLTRSVGLTAPSYTFYTGGYGSLSVVDQVIVSFTINLDGTGDIYLVDLESGNGTVILPNPLADITLYAQWVDVLKITYDGNGSTSGTMPHTNVNSYPKGFSKSKYIIPNKYVKTGFLFNSWCGSPDGMGARYPVGSYIQTTNNDIILYAIWEVAYTLSFDANVAGLPNGTLPPALSILYTGGSSKTLQLTEDTNNHVKAGFVKVAWNTAADGSGIRLPFTSTITLMETNLTLYLEWLPEYKVGFISNFASLSNFANLVTTETHSVIFTIPTTYTRATNPISRGWVDSSGSRGRFLSWNTAIDGTGTTYNAGDKINILKQVINLYGQWEITPRISFYDAFSTNNSGGVLHRHFEIDDTYIFTNYLATKGHIGIDDKFFKSWNTAHNGTGITYNIGDSITLTNNTPIILYAQWVVGRYINLTNNLSTYTSIMAGSVSSGVLAVSAPVEIGVPFTVPSYWTGTLTNDRWAITAWNTAPDGTGTNYEIGDSIDTSVSDQLYLYAQWTYKPKLYYYAENSLLGVFPYNVVYLSDKNKYAYFLRDAPTNYIGAYNTTIQALIASWEVDPPYFQEPLVGNSLATYGCWYYAYNSLYPLDPDKKILKVIRNLPTMQQAILEWHIGTKRVPAGVRALAGDTVTIATDYIDENNTMVKDNAVFVDWSLSGTNNYNTLVGGSSYVMPLNDTILYGHFKYQSTVVYETTESTGGTVPAPVAYGIGDVVTIQDCTLFRQHWEHLGWRIGIENVNPTPYDYITLETGTTFLMPERANGNVTLRPIWRALPTVTYIANGNAMELPVFASYLVGTTVVVDYVGGIVNNITNKKFSHWSTNSDDDYGVDYVVGDTFVITANVTLFAIWKSYVTVEFYYDAGIIETDSFADGTVIQLKVELTTLNNRQFDRWSLGQGEFDPKYVRESNFTISSSYGNVIRFYAVWKPLDVVTENPFYTVYVKPK